MILYILIAVFILGIVVFFHELGHFLLAKKNGIKVYTFSIGFGPKIWGKEYKGTEYRISAVPFGGYVAMAGEELEDRKGDPDEFASKTLWQRFQVVFAGPLMNFILAFVVIWLALIIGVNEPVRETELKIGWIEEESIAREAGMAVGDTITALNGKPVKNWKDFTNKLIFSKEDATITWLSQGKTMTADITLKRDPYTGMVLFGAAPGHPAVVRAVESESPAGKAGILPGDRIVSLDGEEITCAEELVMRLMSSEEGRSSLLLTVERNGEELSIPVEAVWDEETHRTILGVDLTPEIKTQMVRYNIFAAVGRAFKKLLGMIAQLFVILKLLLTGDLPARSMGGAIGIVQMTAQVAQFGFVAVLEFIAFISVNLGIVNLLPIPIADGGQIVFLGIEKATGRPLSKKTMGVIMNIGLYLVIALLILTTYNDIMRIIKGVF